MKLNYYPDTDSLYIDLSDRPGADVVEVANHVIVDLSRLEVEGLRLSLGLESPPKSRAG